MLILYSLYFCFPNFFFSIFFYIMDSSKKKYMKYRGKNNYTGGRIKLIDKILERSRFHNMSAKNIEKSFFHYDETNDVFNNGLNIIKFDFDINNNKIKIGSGSFGSVYKGFLNKEEICIKEIEGNESNINLFFSELFSVQNYSSDHSVKYRGFSVVQTVTKYKILYKLYIFMDFIRGISLEKYIFSNDLSCEYQQKKLINIANMLLLEIQKLHNAKIYHRDLKPENIIINEKFEPVVIDFGFSCEYTYCADNDFLGTFLYSSPETLFSLKNGEKSFLVKNNIVYNDIWSLGCVIFFIFAKKNLLQPYNVRSSSVVNDISNYLETSFLKNMENIIINQKYYIPPFFKDELVFILLNLLNIDFKKRTIQCFISNNILSNKSDVYKKRMSFSNITMSDNKTNTHYVTDDEDEDEDEDDDYDEYQKGIISDSVKPIINGSLVSNSDHMHDSW